MSLTPFPDTGPALQRLKSVSLPLGIISNGCRFSIDQAVSNSGLNWAFDQMFSVEEVQVFKPDPRVYRLAESRMECTLEDILFVSSKAWDASAAPHFGFPVCWVNRQGGHSTNLALDRSTSSQPLMNWVTGA